MTLTNCKIQLILDVLHVVACSVWAERDGRFIKVNFLPRCSFVVVERFLDGITIVAVGLEEDQTIVREEKVSNPWALSGNLNPLK